MADPILFELTLGRLVFKISKWSAPRVFVVHGHDHDSRQKLAQFLRKAGFEPIILDEQPSQGLTIIEKFEHYSKSVAFTVVLLTPDDVGGPKLGRQRVVAINRGEVEIPSDYHGVAYVPWDDDGQWKIRLIQEAENAGIQVSSSYAGLLQAKQSREQVATLSEGL